MNSVPSHGVRVALAALTLVLAGCTASVGAAGAPTAPPPSKPERQWAIPPARVATEQGVQVAVLATLLGTASPVAGAQDDYVTVIVAVSAPTPAAQAALDPAKLTVSDSTGGQAKPTYTELVRRDGVTVGAVTFKGLREGRRTYALNVGAVTTSTPASSEDEAGSWRVEILDQLADRPAPGRLTGLLGEHPLHANGVTVRYVLGGGGPEGRVGTVEVVHPVSGTERVHVAVTRPDGDVRTLTQQEAEEFFPGSRARTPVPTPRPESPSRR